MKNIKTQKSVKREDQITQGAYDGRYREKVVKDKKKDYNKYLCRTKVR